MMVEAEIEKVVEQKRMAVQVATDIETFAALEAVQRAFGTVDEIATLVEKKLTAGLVELAQKHWKLRRLHNSEPETQSTSLLGYKMTVSPRKNAAHNTDSGYTLEKSFVAWSVWVHCNHRQAYKAG